jgi:hypothetical protein
MRNHTGKQSSSKGCGTFVLAATPPAALILAPTRFSSPPARMGSKTVCSVPLHRARKDEYRNRRRPLRCVLGRGDGSNSCTQNGHALPCPRRCRRKPLRRRGTLKRRHGQ